LHQTARVRRQRVVNINTTNCYYPSVIIGWIAVTVNYNLPYIVNAFDFLLTVLDLNRPVISFCSCKIVNYMAQCFHDFHIHGCV